MAMLLLPEDLRDFVRGTVAPLLLLTSCPIFINILVRTNLEYNGSIAHLWEDLLELVLGTLQLLCVLLVGRSFLNLAKGRGGLASDAIAVAGLLALLMFPGRNPLSVLAVHAQQMKAILLSSDPKQAIAWKVIFSFGAFELFLMRALPGPEFRGPVTENNEVPIYKANGVLAFVVTMLTFIGLTHPAGPQLFKASIVYDNFPEIVGALNVFALLFCAFLTVKGRVAPSSRDHGVNDTIVMDYYWGTELYPRVFGFDVKMFTNCRFGMMGWGVLLLSYAAAQYEKTGHVTDAMFVAVGIQLVYIAKFFWWETGYLRSIDIMLDRAGFYICWGCLVWLPVTYTNSTIFLVKQTHTLGLPLAAAIFLAGVGCVWLNYTADIERQEFRRTDGDCLIWGKKPQYISAEYTTTDGKKHKNKLLTTGWFVYGGARHFHYLPELGAAFFWSVPGGFNHVVHWFYFVFLVILLTDRALRDETKMAAKYGKYYVEYKKQVPYYVIPYIF